MVKVVIFDCFGVLTEDAWHAFRTTLPAQQSAEAHELMRQYSSGFISADEFALGVSAITGKTAAQIKALLETGKNKNTNLLEYIEGLRGRGYKIGMVSNIADNWVRETFLTAREQELFDDMVFSYEVGVTKPDPTIFHKALSNLQVIAREAVFIDDIESYCTAARELGMQAIHYDNFGQMKRELEALLAADTDH